MSAKGYNKRTWYISREPSQSSMLSHSTLWRCLLYENIHFFFANHRSLLATFRCLCAHDSHFDSTVASYVAMPFGFGSCPRSAYTHPTITSLLTDNSWCRHEEGELPAAPSSRRKGTSHKHVANAEMWAGYPCEWVHNYVCEGPVASTPACQTSSHVFVSPWRQIWKVDLSNWLTHWQLCVRKDFGR